MLSVTILDHLNLGFARNPLKVLSYTPRILDHLNLGFARNPAG